MKLATIEGKILNPVTWGSYNRIWMNLMMRDKETDRVSIGDP